MSVSMTAILSDCHKAAVMSTNNPEDSHYYRCTVCGKECTVHKPGKVAAAPKDKAAEAAMDEFCSRVDRELESPERDVLEAAKQKFISDEMNKTHTPGDACKVEEV